MKQEIDIDRLLGTYYWVELPMLVNKFFDERNIEEYYSSYDESKTDLKITLEIIDMILNFKLSGKTFDESLRIEFSERQKQNPKHRITREKVLALIPDLNPMNLHRRVDGIFDNFLIDCCDLAFDHYIKHPRLPGLITSRISNLHYFYVLCGDVSDLRQHLPDYDMYRLYKKRDHGF